MSLKPVAPSPETRTHVTFASAGQLPYYVQELGDAIHTTTQELIHQIGIEDGARYVSRKHRFTDVPRGVLIDNAVRDTPESAGGMSAIGLYRSVGFVVEEHPPVGMGWRLKRFESYNIANPKSTLRSSGFDRSHAWMRDVGQIVFGFRLYTPGDEAREADRVYCTVEVTTPSDSNSTVDARTLPDDIEPRVYDAISTLKLLAVAAE